MALILITDDSAFTRKALGKMVRAEGHEIIEAANGRECLNLITERKPDCLLIDLIMPEMGGMEVLKVLHRKGPKIPTIVVTADIQTSVRTECFENGAMGFLNKPPDEDELQYALGKALKRGREAADGSDT